MSWESVEGPSPDVPTASVAATKLVVFEKSNITQQIKYIKSPKYLSR